MSDNVLVDTDDGLLQRFHARSTDTTNTEPQTVLTAAPHTGATRILMGTARVGDKLDLRVYDEVVKQRESEKRERESERERERVRERERGG